MAERAQVDVFFSTQSIYCYALIDRLFWLRDQGVPLRIRPVLGGIVRVPERYKGRGDLEKSYFVADSRRTLEMLGLPYAPPDPSPIVFCKGPGWAAEPEQPRNDWLNRLFVAAVEAGAGFAFLNHVLRGIWDGSLTGWDAPGALAERLGRAGLSENDLLAAMPLARSRDILAAHAEAMLDAGHWGVPLMVYRDEPFYGQDRFDQLLWRMRQLGDLPSDTGDTQC